VEEPSDEVKKAMFIVAEGYIKSLEARVKELEVAVTPFVHGVLHIPEVFDWERGHIRTDVLAWEWKHLKAVLEKKP
jgi:hypothetical protein